MIKTDEWRRLRRKRKRDKEEEVLRSVITPSEAVFSSITVWL